MTAAFEFVRDHVVEVLPQLTHDRRRPTSTLVIEEFLNVALDDRSGFFHCLATVAERAFYSLVQVTDIDAADMGELTHFDRHRTRHPKVDHDDMVVEFREVLARENRGGNLERADDELRAGKVRFECVERVDSDALVVELTAKYFGALEGPIENGQRGD